MGLGQGPGDGPRINTGKRLEHGVMLSYSESQDEDSERKSSEDMTAYSTVEGERLLSDAARRRSRYNHPQRLEPHMLSMHPRRLVYMCGFCASLTSVLLGYDVGVMSVARKYVDVGLSLTATQSEIVMGSLNLIAAFGGLIAGKSADHLGRNRAIAVACVIFVVGSTCMTVAQTFATMLVGRVITGLGVGCGFVIAPVYIAEITPPDIRGMMVSMTDVCINVGIVLGSVVGLVCEQAVTVDDTKWRVMLGIGLVPPLVILTTLRFLPESPRWLLLKDRVSEARGVLNLICGNEEAADREVIAIEEAIQVEKDVTSDWKEVFCPKHASIGRPVLLGLALGILQQASGSEATVYYAPKIFNDIGIRSEVRQSLANIGVAAFKFMGEIMAMFTMDIVGRKPLFQLSAFGSTVFLVVAGLCFQLAWHPAILVFSLCLFMGFFSVGLGAITFVVASEIFPLAVRGKAMALTVFVNRFFSGAVALCFLSMVSAMSYAGCFFLFATISFVSILFYTAVLPETKGKSLEEITMLFESTSGDHCHSEHTQIQQSSSGYGGSNSTDSSRSFTRLTNSEMC